MSEHAIISKDVINVNIYGEDFRVASEPKDVFEWIAKGTWEPFTFAVLRKYLTKDTSFVDAGAWIGTMSLFGSRLAKRVFAIEPDPIAFRILINNLSLNNVDNVVPYEIALTRNAGTVSLGGSMLGCSCTRMSCSENAVSVPSISLREFCSTIPDPLFIKMDVEGAEAEILRDIDFFAERKPTLLLSAHPCWWLDAKSSCDREYETMNAVARLYKYRLDPKGHPADMYSAYTEILLTDKE